MAKKIPHPMVWQFDTTSLRGKQYLKDLDFIHEHTLVDHISIACVDGVQLENLQQCHEAMKELVAHAHELGIKVVFRNTGVEGFFNALVNTPAGTPVEVDQAQIFPLDHADEAEGIVNDYELTADENGRAVLELRPFRPGGLGREPHRRLAQAGFPGRFRVPDRGLPRRL